MRQAKTYEATDRMIDLIRDDYNILQTLSSFGIKLGFKDLTVEQVCYKSKVDCKTFLAVVNMTINRAKDVIIEDLDATTLLGYLSNCHRYFLDYQLPFVRRSLLDALDKDKELSGYIIQMYDEYAEEIHRHMNSEERLLFPYVKKLLNGEVSSNYCIDDFAKHHPEADKSLKELKQLIIMYLPEQEKDNNALISTLYLIYNNEQWLVGHQQVEDSIFVPVIRKLEQQVKAKNLNTAMSAFASNKDSANGEVLSDREKEVIIQVVQGKTNKEIADKLCISTNTVLTHRKNIAKKLQIHSPAGLTIYAIVNGLVDISNLKQ